MYPETIIYSKTDRVKCSGENNDHPLVYYTIPEGGEVVCGYCDIIFRKEEEKHFKQQDYVVDFPPQASVRIE